MGSEFFLRRGIVGMGAECAAKESPSTRITSHAREDSLQSLLQNCLRRAPCHADAAAGALESLYRAEANGKPPDRAQLEVLPADGKYTVNLHQLRAWAVRKVNGGKLDDSRIPAESMK